MSYLRGCLLFSAVMSLAGCATPTRVAVEPSPGTKTLTVMTYNVNYGLGGNREALDIIARANADMVFLQETTPTWERSIRASLGNMYPHMRFHDSRGAGGLAVLSKHAFEETLLTPSPPGWFPAMRVTAATPIGAIQVLQVHLHPPVSDRGSLVSGYFTTKDTREREIEWFTRDMRFDSATIVLGDFNEGHRGRAVEFLRKRGMRSVFYEFNPKGNTWRGNTYLGQLTQTLDHILYSGALEPIGAKIFPEGPSDHLPLIATFAIPK